MIFEAVKILVPLVTHIAFVRLFFLHAHCAWVWLIVVRVKDRECAVAVFLQSLILVSMCFVVFETVRVTIRLV